ncbi:MAG: lytic transglycosylase domain-containing protein, partial [Anaeromyxobacteraceae bacterium]|nr:lytic transglycosylase domain-containing protein [Anaeromyxobacteraceae bacterium]
MAPITRPADLEFSAAAPAAPVPKLLHPTSRAEEVSTGDLSRIIISTETKRLHPRGDPAATGSPVSFHQPTERQAAQQGSPGSSHGRNPRPPALATIGLPRFAAIVSTASASIPYETEIDAALAETGAIYPAPKALVVAVISVESGFRPEAASPAGAKGLMQLMPNTARRTGIDGQHVFDPAQNILGGVRLLAVLLRHYNGDVIPALVAYNARPRRVFSPVPRNGETPQFVWKVLSRTRSFELMLSTPR